MPADLTIDTYSINEGEIQEIPANKKIESKALLNGKNVFTAEDTQTIRCFWSWAEGGYDEGQYNITANVELKQFLV